MSVNVCTTVGVMYVLHVTKACYQLFDKLFKVIEHDCSNDIQMFFGIKSIGDELCSRRASYIY